MGLLSEYLLDEKRMKSILSVFRPNVNLYQKKDILKPSLFKENRLYLVLEGTLYTYMENEYYETELSDYFKRGSFFTGSMLDVFDNQSVRYAMCKSDCRIAELDLGNPSSGTDALLSFACRSMLFHSQQHCHILQQKNLHNKILAYLQYEALCQQTRHLTVPIPYTDLSNYLQADRSSLMKELSVLAREARIVREGKRVILP